MKKIIFVLLLALAMLPGVALADNISYQGTEIPGLKVKGYVGWERTSASTSQFDVSWDEGEVLAAYCADLLTSGVGGEYNVQSLSSFDYDQYESLYQAAWIMENYSPSLTSVDDAYAKETATAVQAALWTLFDGFSLTSVSGNWWQQNYVTSLYYEMLAASAGVDFSTYSFKYDFKYATSGKKQDLLMATPGGGAAAPEPGSMLLMGSALLGTAGYLRRRRKAKPKTA